MKHVHWGTRSPKGESGNYCPKKKEMLRANVPDVSVTGYSLNSGEPPILGTQYMFVQ